MKSRIYRKILIPGTGTVRTTLKLWNHHETTRAGNSAIRPWGCLSFIVSFLTVGLRAWKRGQWEGFPLLKPGKGGKVPGRSCPCPLVPMFVCDKSCSQRTSCLRVVEVKSVGRWKGEWHFKMWGEMSLRFPTPGGGRQEETGNQRWIPCDLASPGSSWGPTPDLCFRVTQKPSSVL